MDVVRHGVLKQSGELWTLRFGRGLGHPPERVWTALTAPDDLEGWFPTEVRGEWVVGARLEFPPRDEDSPACAAEPGTVLQVQRPSVLEYVCGPETLLFLLSPGSAGTHLELVVTLGELGRAADAGAGWHEALDLLEACLDGDERWPPGRRRPRLAPAYAAAFGPSAATVGFSRGRPVRAAPGRGRAGGGSHR
jgi:uncharacterized protein YndB with AHSA1/START domain